MTTPFVGRAIELAKIEAPGARPLVTLWGPGGVGKTRLAREIFERAARSGQDVAWADLSTARTSRDVLPVVANALSVRLHDGDDSDLHVSALHRALHAQGALLVVDNVEQLDDAARAAIGAIAATSLLDVPADVSRTDVARGRRAARDAAPSPRPRTTRQARVIATSREGLGVTGELMIEIAPLPEDDAVRLLGELASTSREAALEIVRRLDALPLAIELAAARIPLLGEAGVLARMDRKLDVLASASSESRPSRHSSLRASIAWSWELLDASDRDALRACATFEGPFDVELAQRVLDGTELEALDRLDRLRARALLHTSIDRAGRARLHLLESVRDFVRDAPDDSEVDWERRWRRHDAAVVARAEPLAEDARCGRDTFRDLEMLRADLTAASARRGSSSARATIALCTLIAISGPATFALEYSTEALRRAKTIDDEATRIALLVARGEALRALGRLEEARAVLEEARNASAANRGAPATALLSAEASRLLGSVMRGLGRTAEALAYKDAAIAIVESLGDHARAGIYRGEIGAVHQSEGRFGLAMRQHAEAIGAHITSGARRAEGIERSHLAVATHRSGDPRGALPLHEMALAIHREVGHRRLEGAELLHLGFVHHELGDAPAARAAYHAARESLAMSGARGLEALGLVFAARLEVDEGRVPEALVLLSEASHVAPESWPRLHATRRLVDGHLSMMRRDFVEARRSYEDSLALSRDTEVGFEALTPAYLALALALDGSSAARADATRPSTGATIETHLAETEKRLRDVENPLLVHAFAVLGAGARGLRVGDVPAESIARSSEVRRALALTGRHRAIEVGRDGRSVVLPTGQTIDLARRGSVRGVLLALARARRDAPGSAIAPSALLEAGWPGERMRPTAATKRLHTAIWTLRTLGLEAYILTEGEGYLFDPSVELHVL